MGIFKKKNITPQDVDRYYQKKNDDKLIKLLKNENPSIAEKAEKALCALAANADAKKERSHWPEVLFDIALKKLESTKLSEHKEAIAPYIQALKCEKQEIFKIKHQLEEAGISDISHAYLNEIKGVLEPDENIEYATTFGRGRRAFSELGVFLTNERIIFYDRGYAFNRFRPKGYYLVKEIKRSSWSTEIIFIGGVSFKIPFVAEELISHIARHVPKLKVS